jgi:signal transduction histidine kinase
MGNILKKLSLKLRLTLLFSVILTGLLIAFSSILYSQFKELQSVEFDTILFNYAIDVADSLDIDSYGDVEFDPDIIKLNDKILPFSLGKSYIAVLDVNDNIVARTSNVTDDLISPLSEATLGYILKKGSSYYTFNYKGSTHRVINYLLPVLKIDSPLVLQITVPMTVYEKTNKNLRRFFLISIPIIMLISCLVGYAFVARALRPMIEITEKTKKIEVTNLKDRVPYPMAKDEIWNLADTINHLLTRIDFSFMAQERFIQDASHQLKTPLAILKGEFELFRASKKTEQETNLFFESSSQEINTLVKLTNDLLILARVDAGVSALEKRLSRLDEVVINQVSRLSKVANFKQISLQINFEAFEVLPNEELSIWCDPDLLGVLFYNLVENAIKYSEANSVVIVRGGKESGRLIIEVSDSAGGIKEELLEKIFERFYRAESSSHKVLGSGLGLAICKIVANIHQAKLFAKNNDQHGTTFTFEMDS